MPWLANIVLGATLALDCLSPVMEDLRTRDIGNDERLLSFISHISGELLLVSEDGTNFRNQ